MKFVTILSLLAISLTALAQESLASSTEQDRAELRKSLENTFIVLDIGPFAPRKAEKEDSYDKSILTISEHNLRIFEKSYKNKDRIIDFDNLKSPEDALKLSKGILEMYYVLVINSKAKLTSALEQMDRLSWDIQHVSVLLKEKDDHKCWSFYNEQANHLRAYNHFARNDKLNSEAYFFLANKFFKDFITISKAKNCELKEKVN